MKVFKFGGASVKDVNSIKGVFDIVRKKGEKRTLLVISAMGKTTNLIEDIIDAHYDNSVVFEEKVNFFKAFHYNIISEILPKEKKVLFAPFFEEFISYFKNKDKASHSFLYDQTIGYGELLSTKILSEYLEAEGLKNHWIDARSVIKTDSNYRDACVDWKETKRLIKDTVKPDMLTITQGFIAGDTDGHSTSLGREGSDFTAAIFAHCLDAKEVTIWKDVPGVLNADPRYFKNPKLLKKIPYHEATELAFYGASVIHPKTLKPLQNKNIPLYVKSFLNPDKDGTCIYNYNKTQPEKPCFILKKNLILLSISTTDNSFIDEHNISQLFEYLHTFKFKVALMQNSALSFSVCLEHKYDLVEILTDKLKEDYHVQIFKEVTLYTIRNGKIKDVRRIEKGKNVLLKQRLGDTIEIAVG